MWIAKNATDATPQPGGCLIVNKDIKSDSLIMLMDPADVNFPPTQVCNISPQNGLLIPLWMGWCENSGSNKGFSDEQLLQCAKEQNLGQISSEVKVDGVPVAKLDTRNTVNSHVVDFNVKSLMNVLEHSSKGFSLTIPTNTHKPNQNPGEWRGVSQGWWVFLKEDRMSTMAFLI